MTERERQREVNKISETLKVRKQKMKVYVAIANGLISDGKIFNSKELEKKYKYGGKHYVGLWDEHLLNGTVPNFRTDKLNLRSESHNKEWLDDVIDN